MWGERGPATWFSITLYISNAQAENLQMRKAPDFSKVTSLIMSYRPLLTTLLWKSLSLWVGEAQRRRPARPSAAQTLDLLAEEWECWCLKWMTLDVVISGDNSPFTRAGEKEKDLHVPVICVYLLACWWGHLRREQFFLSPAACHAMQLPVC